MSSQFSFTTAPSIKYNRSSFPLNHNVKTSMNVGDLCPVFVEEVLPGDTFKCTAKFLSRLTSSFLKVPLDNLFLDLNFFFVPNRLIWDHWVNMMGENTEGYWTNTSTYTVPLVQVSTLSTGLGNRFPQSVLDYLGAPLPIGSTSYNMSQLPARAFAKIWNDWYRNENTQAPVQVAELGDGLRIAYGDPWAPNNIFGRVPKASKIHDYFTSALPAPQKGAAVELPLSVSDVPVYATNVVNSFMAQMAGLKMYNASGGTDSGNLGVSSGSVVAEPGVFSGASVQTPSNLHAILDEVNAGTVNDLRLAFALQRMLERDAIGGTRYTEMIQAQYGVVNPDSRLQRSEYLGGFRTPINFQQVAQTSQGSEDSPQANLSAYSQTAGQGGFVKSFTEFGYVIGVACIRQRHTYSQGLDKRLTRTTRLDYFNPAFAHIGMQPISTREIYQGSIGQIFGYTPAWSEYRFHPDRVSGYMRPSVIGGLAQWSFADVYDSAPVLNQSFLNETSKYVDRTLSVPSNLTPNFLMDFQFDIRATRLVPANDTPGLIDHVGNH